MRKMGKYLITALVLTALMAIFAFSANAATHEVTSQATWDNMISSVANADNINVRGGATEAETLTITVDGTDVVKGVVEVYGYVKFVGANNGRISYTRSGTGYSGVNIASGAVVTLENITVANDTGTSNRAMRVRAGGRLTVEEGTVITGGKNTGGGIYLVANGTAVMNGGSITENTGSNGAGVYVEENGRFIMNGGSITANTASSSGGGLYITCGAKVEFNGGSVTDNKTTGGNGGGMHLGNASGKTTTVTWNSDFVCSGNSQKGDVADAGSNVNLGSNGSLDVTWVVDWHGVEDINAYSGKFATGAYYSLGYIRADKFLIKVYNDITVSNNIKFNAYTNSYGTMPITVIGAKEGGSAPTITFAENATSDTGFIYLYDNCTVSIDGVNFDVGIYTPGETPERKLRVAYVGKGSNLTVANSTLKGGARTDTAGGCVYIEDSGSLTLNSGAVITECYAKTSGAIYMGGSTATMTMNAGSKIEKCVSSGSAGAIYVAGVFDMVGGIIDSCESLGGDGAGAVYVTTTGQMNMSNGEIKNNKSTGQGGAIYNWKGIVNISGGAITGNVAYHSTSGYQMGGAIRSAGTVTISGSAVISGNKGGYGNVVSVSPDGGVAVLNINGGTIENNITGRTDGNAGVYAHSGEFNMTSGIIRNNISGKSAYGGGIRIATCTVAITGGTISGNYAGYGGGISVAEGNVTTLTNVTITNNDANVAGGGVYIGSPKASVYVSGNTVITDNTLKETTTCNVQKNTGFRSYDEDIYSGNNWTNGWVIIDSEFTGNVGVYFPALPISMDFNEVKLGVIADGATVSGKIINDNGKFTYAEMTDANGAACIALEATKTTLKVNLADGSTKDFSVADFDFYTLPTQDEFGLEGYTADDFIGYVKVSGHGTEDVVAEAIIAEGTVVTADELADLYATWVKVETLTGASAQISENSGIKFFTKVNSAVLESVGIKVKAANAEGDGYSRGTLLATSASDLSEGFTKETAKKVVKINNAGWIVNTIDYGFRLNDGESAFAATIIYNTDQYYTNAVAFRGYIDITVGGKTVTVYSDFTAPETMSDEAEAVYGDVHARSACAVVRNNYFEEDGEGGYYMSGWVYDEVYGKYDEDQAAEIISAIYSIACLVEPSEV